MLNRHPNVNVVFPVQRFYTSSGSLSFRKYSATQSAPEKVRGADTA